MIDRYRNKAIEQRNHITLTKQLRMQRMMRHLNGSMLLRKKQIINKIPHHDYENKKSLIHRKYLDLENTEKKQTWCKPGTQS